MRKHATTLLAPLAALAIAGTVGAAPAQAHGDGDHERYGNHQQSRGHDDRHGHGHGQEHRDGHEDSKSAEIVTSEEATVTLAAAGVTVDALDPATAESQEDGTVRLSFPKAEDDAAASESGEVAFDGGISYATDTGGATWLEPTVDTDDWTVSFDVDGQRVDLLQVVPEEGGDEAASYGSKHGHGDEAEFDLALTADGATALNEVAGDGAFAEGDILAQSDDGKDC